MCLLHTDPEPVVIHGLGGLEPVSSANLQQFVDQVNRYGNRDRETSMIPHTHTQPQTHTFLGDVGPGVGRVHERSVLYLVRNLLILVEWECATQTAERKHRNQTLMNIRTESGCGQEVGVVGFC